MVINIYSPQELYLRREDAENSWRQGREAGTVCWSGSSLNLANLSPSFLNLSIDQLFSRNLSLSIMESKEKQFALSLLGKNIISLHA